MGLGNAVPGSNPNSTGPQGPHEGPSPAGWFAKAVADVGKQMKAMKKATFKFVTKIRFSK